MQSPLTRDGVTDDFVSTMADPVPESDEKTLEPFWFCGSFVGSMDMFADVDTVANYLDVHEGWFRRCADPMQAELIGENAYALSLGRYGAMGYDVEPKVGLELVPQQERIYRIVTVPIPDYEAPGYEVDFRAVQTLAAGTDEDDRSVTRVDWELDLSVGVYFPRFVRVFPDALIQKTGDRLIIEIVKQVSRRLTRKVQEDFHQTLGEEALAEFRSLQKQRDRFSCEPKGLGD